LIVLGLFEGNVEIFLNGTTFQAGKAITGRCRLTLKEPMEARELRAEFYGEQGKHHTRVFEVRRPLSGSRTYRSGEEFEFSLLVPAQAFPKNTYTGLIGGLVDFASKYLHPIWYVSVSLDMPNKVDIYKIVPVNLTASDLAATPENFPGVQPQSAKISPKF
jgi:hypothetical protein